MLNYFVVQRELTNLWVFLSFLAGIFSSQTTNYRRQRQDFLSLQPGVPMTILMQESEDQGFDSRHTSKWPWSLNLSFLISKHKNPWDSLTDTNCEAVIVRNYWDRRDGAVVKSTPGSSSGPRSGSQHSHGGWQLSVISLLGDLTPSPGQHEQSMSTVHIHVGNTLT